MPNTPKQPVDPPSEGGSPVDNPPGQGRLGIPDGQCDHDAASTPDNSRHETETAPSRIESDCKP